MPLAAGATQRACLRPARIQFRRSIEGLQDEWQGWTYDLLSRNCNHFCEALVEILGVGPLPGACDERRRVRNGTRPLPLALNRLVLQRG